MFLGIKYVSFDLSTTSKKETKGWADNETGLKHSTPGLTTLLLDINQGLLEGTLSLHLFSQDQGNNDFYYST